MALPDKQPVPAKSVMELRRLTGYGVMACKLLLKKTGSLDAALEYVNDRRLSGNIGHSVGGICPNCDAGLSKISLTECAECGWVKYKPKNRILWGRVGQCPDCGFSYRWDGDVCSGCGNSIS